MTCTPKSGPKNGGWSRQETSVVAASTKIITHATREVILLKQVLGDESIYPIMENQINHRVFKVKDTFRNHS